MKPIRKTDQPSKATLYRGNGKSYPMYGGFHIPRELTKDELIVESAIREKYEDLLGDFYFSAGTNMGKSIWLIRLQGGYEIESNISLQDLECELGLWLAAHPKGVHE